MRNAIYPIIPTIFTLFLGCSGATFVPGDAGVQETPGKDGGDPDDIGLSSIDDFIDNSIKGPPEIDMSTYRLTIKGLVDNPREFTFEEATGGFPYYEKIFMLKCVEGWSVNIRWGGVRLNDLFEAAKARMDSPVVIFTAYDGYSTSLPLSYIHDNNIMLAYMVNGETMPPKIGFPFFLAAEGKWGYKWIKWVSTVELSNDMNYLGFWESRGYSNDGDLDKPFFEEKNP